MSMTACPPPASRTSRSETRTASGQLTQARNWRHTRHNARNIFLCAARVQPTATALEQLQTQHASECWALAAEAAIRTHQEPLFQHLVARHCPQAPLHLAIKHTLETQKKLHAFRWEELRESLSGVLEALAQVGVQPLLLKGAGCVGDLYHLPHLRPMRDLDILVRATELQVAEKALTAWGFTHSKHLSNEDYEDHHHAEPLFHPQTGVCVELHHDPICKSAKLPGVPSPDEFWNAARESRVPLSSGPQPAVTQAFVLEPTFVLLVTCLHFTHGDHIGDRVAHLFDLARLFELRGEELDWERLLHYGRFPAVASSLALTLLYLNLEGLPSGPASVLEQLCRTSELRPWEIRSLVSLIDRYRIGLPGRRPGISPRIGNILWRRLLERQSLWKRGRQGLRDVLSRGRHSREYHRAKRTMETT
jgi:hypothetical protein